MFAKLKQKIQLEGGNVEADKGSPAQSPLYKDRGDDGMFSSKDDLTKLESKEDLSAALLRRTEQCRKLEAKVSEYIGVVKENNRKIDKLENYIEKQQDVLAKRTQELNEQYQASRVQMSDNFKIELDKKDQEKQELLDKLKETESLKERYSKRDEEKEEIQQFTTQEMGKLKHMLIMKEEELTKLEKEVAIEREKSKHYTEMEATVKALQAEKSELDEASTSHGKVVSNLTRERMELEEQITQLKSSLSQKSSTLSSIEEKYTELESLHQALLRNSELQKNKLSQQLQEKCDTVEQLEERVKQLQQREQDHTLSGDERLIALQKERDGLEKKLSEAREQLSQIKSSWSDKITHLEDQISHLNGKMAEDAEELTEAKQQTQQIKEKMQKEVDAVKEKLRSSEKQAAINLELVNTKEAQFKKERLELETEISKVKLEKVDLDTHIRAKLASVESQMMTLELEKAHEQSQLHDEINKQKKETVDVKEQLSNVTRQLETVQGERDQLKEHIDTLSSMCKSLKEELNEKEKTITDLTTLRDSLQDELKATTDKLEKSQETSKSKLSDLAEIEKEKDELMMRNVELSQQLTTSQQVLQDERRAFNEEKMSLETELTTKIEQEQLLKLHCQQLDSQIEELQNQHSEHVYSSEQVDVLEHTVLALEDQLADRNKALKKQEQRLNDLKKTLQRELKVQSLPNDDFSDSKVTAITPPLSRKNAPGRTQNGDSDGKTRRMTSHERLLSGEMDLTESPGSPDYFVGQNNHPASLRLSMSEKNLYGANSGHATLAVNDPKSTGSFNVSSKSRTPSIREFDMRHLEKDINFQYLKHVVMKFMLSREHEAIQLIKAVSLLLRFTPEEQKLIRDTLEWKMSWFGGSQPPAVLRGQTSKIIPPSY